MNLARSAPRWRSSLLKPRAVDAITCAARSAEDRAEASGEVRIYTQMLLTSAPLLIDASDTRAFL